MRYFFLLNIIYIFFSCKSHIQKETKENVSVVYTPVKNNLLFKDSLHNVYLRTLNILIGTDSIYYEYQNHISYDLVEQDSLIELKNILDIKTFDYINDSKEFYKDKNYVYVHQQYPATYPSLKIIDINPEKAELIKSQYIKDDRNVFFLGIKISENASEFKYIPNNDSLLLFGDGKKIIWNWDEISQDELNEFPISENTKDSLSKIYFK